MTDPQSSAAPAALQSEPAPTPPTADGNEEEVHQQEESSEHEKLITRVQILIDKITSNPDNPNPIVLHAIASILETQESRYMEEMGNSSLNNNRSSHNIGRLGNLIRENDEFFELISATFLSENRYAISVRAAAVRLIFSCSLTWMYPHVFEETVVENIKGWVVDDTIRSSGEDHTQKHDSGRRKSSDSEMLTTYSTGILAVCLTGGGQVVEDVLTSGFAAKLMLYLRIWVLGEPSASQKDANYLKDPKNPSAATCTKGRDDVQGKLRSVSETSHLDEPGVLVEGPLNYEVDRGIGRQVCQDKRWAGDVGASGGLAEDIGCYDTDADRADRWHGQDMHSREPRFGARKWEDGVDESARDGSSRHNTDRGWARSKGKGRVDGGVVENERGLTSPVSEIRLERQGQSFKDRGLIRSQDLRRIPDTKMSGVKTDGDGFAMERDGNDNCFQDCKVGSKDFSDQVKKAVRAAEAEASAANAPAEAIKAAGDAAAEAVKSAALDEFKATNDEEAAVLAASRAATTVVDAPRAVEVSRNSSALDVDSMNPKAAEAEPNVEAVEFFILDIDSLTKLREKFCIQCLQILGEYVEVLGPILHEKGVDVCLVLLLLSAKPNDRSNMTLLLPDVLKLICALAAHRKFAALFVDRGGMQKLLAVPRIPQTFFGLSSCLFTIGSLQGIMERVCALPSDVVHQLVELAIQLLDCPQDQARKNSALFFAAAFVFRAVLDSFDAQDGLRKVLNLLHDAASVRSGVSSRTLGPSGSGSLQSDRSPPNVLTSSEKQIAYHTCVALRQYFRAQLLLLVDTIRPYKNNRSASRHVPTIRAAYKPLDISNEAMDMAFCHLQKDRKLGPAFVRARWNAVDKFLSYNGHILMLELCQAPPSPVERYLHDLLQYALGVLHIITLVSYSRKLIVNATLSNDRVGIAVILDAANGSGSVDPEIIQQALNVLVNLVCPPPSISNKPPLLAQGQQHAVQTSNPAINTRDRNAERSIPGRAIHILSQIESRERNESGVGDRATSQLLGTPTNFTSQTPVSSVASGLVGDRRISLGAGAGCAGLAAQLEQGYHQGREAVRANNGIKVLLQLLQLRIVTPPASVDCLRALACRVLLGLARDDTIAHILTKLQVGKKLSELIRDSGTQTSGSEQGRWQAELAQVAMELIAIVTNSGRASTLAATDATTPTLRRIERAAIAAATPITYHSKDLLLLIHEHLQASGLVASADTLLKEAQLAPLPSLAAVSSLAHQGSVHDVPSIQIHWPSGRSPYGFFSDKSKLTSQDEEYALKCAMPSSMKKPLLFCPAFSVLSKTQLPSPDSLQRSSVKGTNTLQGLSVPAGALETPSMATEKPNMEAEVQFKTPIILPMKRKLTDSKDIGPVPLGKRLNVGGHGLRSPICLTPNSVRKSSLLTDANNLTPATSTFKDHPGRLASGGALADILDESPRSNAFLGQTTPAFQHGIQNDSQPLNSERLTLDSVVVQYLKHQHRQCSAPITTLPPLSLLHPHTCPEPRQSLDAPSNMTARLSTHEFRSIYGGIHGRRRDRQFVYSRFRPWRTCRDDSGGLLTCITFLGDSFQIAAGSHSGELKIFDSNSSNVLESCASHQSPLTLVQSYLHGETQLLLSSSAHDVRLWDASSVSAGPRHSFDGCKAARFSNSGTRFAALSSGTLQREILLYDIQTFQMDLKLVDTSTNVSGRGHVNSHVHFSPSDSMLLWNGILWDIRGSSHVHRFDQFTDYGGGGFHPAGNEVIINSEVWDLRNFRLLRSVPSLDQTVITFNASGDVIYAILRRNFEEISSAFQTRRVKHPLFAAFRTVDAVNYSDIATIPVDRCVFDLATEPTDSFIGLITMDDQDDMYSSAKVYEIGRRRPTDDDSDPDDAESEEDEEDDEDINEDPLLGPDFDGDADSDTDESSNDEDSVSELGDDEDEDADFMIGFDGGNGMLEILNNGNESSDSEAVESLSSGDEL